MPATVERGTSSVEGWRLRCRRFGRHVALDQVEYAAKSRPVRRPREDRSERDDVDWEFADPWAPTRSAAWINPSLTGGNGPVAMNAQASQPTTCRTAPT